MYLAKNLVYLLRDEIIQLSKLLLAIRDRVKSLCRNQGIPYRLYLQPILEQCQAVLRDVHYVNDTYYMY